MTEPFRRRFRVFTIDSKARLMLCSLSTDAAMSIETPMDPGVLFRLTVLRLMRATSVPSRNLP